MIVDGQRYIVIVPSDEMPNVRPDGLQEWHFRDKQWVGTFSGNSLWRNGGGFYRYPVTEAEYRAHHGMLSWPTECPDGYEVVDFRYPLVGEETMEGHFIGEWSGVPHETPQPILRKKACEHKNFEERAYVPSREYTVTCNDCGMVRKLGDWEQSE